VGTCAVSFLRLVASDKSDLIAIFLAPVKDVSASKAIRVDITSCRCGQVYIGQTDRSIEIREKEPRGLIYPSPWTQS
jgi:hypothetical protein